MTEEKKGGGGSQRGLCAVRGTTLILTGSALKVLRYCMIVLLVNLGWLQGKMMGNEEGKVMKWIVGFMQQRTEVEHKG